MKSLDIISITFIQRLTVSIRFYTEPVFGVRCLGGDRWAFDLSYISLIIEVW